ncbi:hypothetical protein BX616_004413 [Lobosporangium transversale]|uniref:Uncharacterized protein n=1 Tax=Lobosporangium transversale TaxID=64571 RepID=A0A1Y2GNA4_9FUNG|nr:hypothetical protein BCR41DRAFT_405961 [Lobosporangium transversale]KAF9918904.1 hypothetical protein BX616_004413 [Lobosporangium transversale]ORZ16178.1 hypothetical protein BCR41DRAFT_405961 [Lobosporangium transversale]|eukprot:XP_021881525.1 hypothetical protein BCR41DRAFT_405961 [Lobosporangium transversale]
MFPIPNGQTDSSYKGQLTPDFLLNKFYNLISEYGNSSSEARKNVLKNAVACIDELINCNVNLSKILVEICGRTTKDNYEMHGRFLKALLDSGHVRWAPSQLVPSWGLNREGNPVSLFLDKAKASSRAIVLAKITIDYYIRMAKETKDLSVASPVLSSLHELVQLHELHSDLVYGTIRQLSFIPVKDPSIIIDRAVVAHPPRFRWMFLKPENQPLHKCKNPVFHLGDSSQLNVSGSAPRDEGFTVDIFAASYDMLWRRPVETSESGSKAQNPWLQAVYSTIHRFRMKSKPAVECHAFTPEMLDNPAIAALIEYKWYNILLKSLNLV